MTAILRIQELRLHFLPDTEIFQETTVFEFDILNAQIKRNGISY